MLVRQVKKSDTRRRHSPCQTPPGAQVALQRCPILPVSKSIFSVPREAQAVNVQPRRRGCVNAGNVMTENAGEK